MIFILRSVLDFLSAARRLAGFGSDLLRGGVSGLPGALRLWLQWHPPVHHVTGHRGLQVQLQLQVRVPSRHPVQFCCVSVLTWCDAFPPLLVAAATRRTWRPWRTAAETHFASAGTPTDCQCGWSPPTTRWESARGRRNCWCCRSESETKVNKIHKFFFSQGSLKT